MKFPNAITLLSYAVFVNAQYDWTCISTQPEYTAVMPECAQECHAIALTTNGCSPDDFICHCKNFWATSQIIEPCVLGPEGTCTQDEIIEFAGIAGEFCGFWNATAAQALADTLAECDG